MSKKPKLNSLPKSINTIDDVWEFFNYLRNVEDVMFHPKQDFGEYIDSETDKPGYTAKEVKERNILMKKCFDICSENDISIFKVAWEVYKKNRNDKKTSSKKTQSNVVVCTLSADYLDEETGEVLSFYTDNLYKIIREYSIWIYVKFSGNDNYAVFPRWEFEKHFRYAEEGGGTIEIEAIKKNRNDKKTSSKKTQSNVAFCILSIDCVENETGEVFEFSINKYYKILYDHPLWLHIGYPGVDSPLTFQRGQFEEHFRYAEEGEITSDML